ncbi:MAG: YncE family protein [bacterium]
MSTRALVKICAGVLLACGSGSVRGAGDPVLKNYYLYVAAESDDAVYLVKFGPEGGRVVKRIPVGIFPTEIEGPHGIRVSPSGRHWYVSIAHGNPYGSVFKYATGDDVAVGDVRAGLFPATMDISPTTGLMLVANFNLHGDMEPGTVSVIDTASMTEVAVIDQGIMPHGSRTSPDGRFHYSVGMMSDELYEIDVMKLEISRRLHLSKDDGEADAHRHAQGHAKGVKPTWVEPHPTKRFVYLALQGADQVVEVDLDEWRIARRFQTQKGPYNLALSSDGKMLLATCKSHHSTAIWDIETGKELASVPSSRRITHGVTISPDNRFAFVTLEGVQGEPGTVDVIDLQTFEIRASIDVGKQASGIDFWKIE